MNNGLNLFLAIGIDKYNPTHWKPLSNAVGDVIKLGKILSEKYGFQKFEEDYLLDSAANWDGIHDWLNRATEFCATSDNLIIYFAGHGLERPEKVGNWIPQTATMEPKTWISHSTVLNYLFQVKAKHIFLIADCCFSGAFVLNQPKLGTSGMSDAELELLQSRVIFSSGELTTVSDGEAGLGSPFGRSLCQVLENNTEPRLRVSRLINDVTRLALTRTHRKPQCCEIDCSDNEKGEMIFRLEETSRLAWGSKDEKPEFPTPDIPDGEPLIERRLTSSSHQHSVADMIFNLEKNSVLLDDIFSKERQMVILGSAGSGKSVELIRLAVSLKPKESPFVPVYKRLHSFSGGDLLEFLGILPDTQNLGSFVILLDGLDEVRPEYFEKAVASIQKCSEEHPLLCIIITCRTNFYDVPETNKRGFLEDFAVYYINDLTWNDIARYSAQILSDGDTEIFLEAAQHSGLADLMSRPFFFRQIFQNYQNGYGLTSSRSELMKQLIQESLKIGGKDSETYPPEKLTHVAFTMVYLGRNFLSGSELELVLNLQPKSNDAVKMLQYDQFKDQWLFEHNNIQEFLAANALLKLSFDQLIELISFKSNGVHRIKPSWLNTVTFLSSVGENEVFEKLFTWIVDNDPEAVIKLEADRLTPGQRLSVFKKIFEFYNTRQIWLSSNMFSRSEMSRFAQSEEILNYLIDLLGEIKSTRITVLNAIHIMFLFEIDKFEDKKESLLGVLMDIVQKSGFGPEDMISVIGVIAHLRLADKEASDFLIQRYRLSKNQYLRAALYRLLAELNLVESNLDIILDGLELDAMKYGLDDRADVNLMDETFNLRLAIEKIKSSKGLIYFLAGISASRQKRFRLSRDNRELIPVIITNSIRAFSEDNKLFETIFNLYLGIHSDFDDHLLKDIAVFFRNTNTRREALLEIWKNTNQELLAWDRLTLSMLDADLISIFVDLVKHKDLDQGSLGHFHSILFQKRHQHGDLLALLEDYAKNQLNIALERPVIIDWSEVELRKSQHNLDALFDNSLMEEDVKRAFAKAGRAMTKDRLQSLVFRNYDAAEKAISQSALDIVRIFTDHKSTASLDEVLLWINTSQAYKLFRVKKIKVALSHDKKLVITDSQVSLIHKWCLEFPDEYELVWFFLHRFGFELPENQLNALTRYSNSQVDGTVEQPGGLEMMEKFLDKQTLHDTVIGNLTNESLNKSAWISNIAYSLRNGLRPGFDIFTNALANRTIDEYKDTELMDLWFGITSAWKTLEEILIATQSMAIKWKGVRMLKSLGQSQTFLLDFLNTILNDTSLEIHDRQEAANQLIEMGDLAGFDFLYRLAVETNDPNLDFRHGFRNLELVKSIDALQPLLELLYLSKTDAYKKDVFNDLESKVHSALISVGQVSEKNAEIVIRGINEFAEKYNGKLPHLNFLYFTIAKINESLMPTNAPTIEGALMALEQLKSKDK